MALKWKQQRSLILSCTLLTSSEDSRRAREYALGIADREATARGIEQLAAQRKIEAESSERAARSAIDELRRLQRRSEASASEQRSVMEALRKRIDEKTSSLQEKTLALSIRERQVQNSIQESELKVKRQMDQMHQAQQDHAKEVEAASEAFKS